MRRLYSHFIKQFWILQIPNQLINTRSEGDHPRKVLKTSAIKWIYPPTYITRIKVFMDCEAKSLDSVKILHDKRVTGDSSSLFFK